MAAEAGFAYEIQYTKAAEKFFRQHEDVRIAYEDSIKELLFGEHPEKIDVKRIKGKRSTYFRIRLGGVRVVYTVINGRIVVICTLLVGVKDTGSDPLTELLRF